MKKRTRRKPVPTEIKTTQVTQLSHEGRGIAHVDGKTTFLFGGLPNETVQFRYTDCHSNYDEGAVTEVLNSASDRAIPLCAHFGVCGGCSLQHLAVKAQRLHKQNSLLEHFQHQAKCQPTEILPPLYGHPWGYRRRARLSVKYVAKKNSVLVGFRERNSSFVAQINRCETLHPSIGHKIDALSALLTQLEMKSHIPQLELAIGDAITAVIVRNLNVLPKKDLQLLTTFAAENNLQLYLQPKGPDSIHCIYPEKPAVLYYEIPSEQIKITFEPGQFTQINQEVNLKMIARAIELLSLKKSDRVLDLFCGIGNFSLPLAKYCAEVVGVEGAKSAIDQATLNAAHNNIVNAHFYTQDLSVDLPKTTWSQQHYDKILLDPPRAGAKELMPYIAVWQPEKIVYVSCNPITLARDAEYLLHLGYHLEKAGVMDMFPHTEHVEAIALFVK